VSDEIISGTPKGTGSSPHWGSTTKLVIGLTIVAILAGLVIRFRLIIAPLFIAFLLAYVLYPVAMFLHKKIKISWQLASAIILLLLLIILIGLLTLSGLAIFNQIQSLITFLQVQIENIPDFIATITSKPIEFGPFSLDLTKLDATSLANQLLSLIQPILTNTATIVGEVAGGAASIIGWIFFTVLVTYFILSDSGGTRARLINIKIPGYSEDVARIGHELGGIWNSFARGQLIIMVITILVYLALLGSLGVNFYYGLALLAGFARFVPYIGPWIAWITYALVSYFQPANLFGMPPIWFAVLVVGIAILIDLLMDNLVVPRMMGDALRVHPAAVLVAAIIFANLFGLFGVLLAAPVMATLQLFAMYVVKKMFDLDPWQGYETKPVKPLPPVFMTLKLIYYRLVHWLKSTYTNRWPNGIPLFTKVGAYFTRLWVKITRRTQSTATTSSGGQDEQRDGS
jgi:predicted PurR-regulated permease PerM